MHGIAPYIFHVEDDSGVKQDLWNLNGKSFFDYLKNDYFPGIKGIPRLVQDSAPGVLGKNYILSKVYQGTASSVAGCVSTGEFGFESDIVDTITKSVIHKRKTHESGMLPFHFCFYAPKTTNQQERLIGVLLLSRFNKLGIRGVFLPNLIVHFASAFPGMELKVEKVVPASFVNAVVKGGDLKKIRLFANKIPDGARKALANAGFDNFYEVEMIIKPKPRTFFSKPAWMSSLKQGVPLNSLITLPDTDITKIKVEVSRLKGRSRTLDISNAKTMAANIEIDKPTLLASNHIDPACWLEEADALADELFLELGLSLIPWNNKI